MQIEVDNDVLQEAKLTEGENDIEYFLCGFLVYGVHTSEQRPPPGTMTTKTSQVPVFMSREERNREKIENREETGNQAET